MCRMQLNFSCIREVAKPKISSSEETTSLEEANHRHATIRSWWSLSGATTKGTVHELNNWLSYGLSTRILHLKGEKVFGSAKCKVDLPPRLEANSH